MIECYGASNWLTTLKARYNIAKTTLRDSPEAFTVIMGIGTNKVLLVARFDRTRQYGVVLCQRKRNIKPEYEKRSN